MLIFSNCINCSGTVLILQFMNIERKQGAWLLCAFVTLASCGSAKKGGRTPSKVAGTWQATPMNIDGDCTDWPSPYPNYDAKAKVAYATSNDAENLYITIQTGDPLTQIKMLKQGLAVSVDTGGRKDVTFTINYPLQNTDDLAELFAQSDAQNSGSPTLSRQFEQKLKKSLEAANQYTLEGYGTCSGGYMISQEAPCGIRVKAGIDEYKQLVWEAIIPMKALYGKNSISATEAGKAISVCYSIKGFKAPSTKGESASMPMNNNMGRQGGMAGGRMNSMPMGASTSNKSGGPLAHLYESTKTWKFFSLTWQGK
jgi:hypothetical protein